MPSLKVIIFSRVFVITVKTNPFALVWCILGLNRSFLEVYIYTYIYIYFFFLKAQLENSCHALYGECSKCITIVTCLYAKALALQNTKTAL